MSAEQICVVVFSNLLMFVIIDLGCSIYGVRRIKNNFINLGIFIFASTLNTILFLYVPVQLLYILLSFITVVVYSLKYKMPVVKHIVSVTVIWIMGVLSEMLFGFIYSFIYDYSIPETQSNPIVAVQITLLSKIILILILVIIRLKYSGKQGTLAFKVAGGLSVLPTVTFGLLYLITRLVYESEDVTLKTVALAMTIMLIVCNIVVFALFHYILDQGEKTKKIELNSEIIQLEKNYYETLSFRQEKSSRVIHDLKNKAFALEEMVRVGDPIALEKLSEMSGIIVDSQPKCYIGVPSVDYLIDTKVGEARAKGIEFTVSSSIYGAPKTSAVDLCVILGNLLDNSIEACDLLPDGKVINVRIKNYKEYLSISISNPLIIDYSKKNLITRKTSKTHEYIHGFGIANVKEIVIKYNGLYDVIINDNMYTTNIMI